MPATADNDSEERSALPSCVKPSDFSMDQAYTTALLRGRHPRSFRHERGIYQYVNDSNKRANKGQKGHAQHHHQHQHQPVIADPDCLLAPSGGVEDDGCVRGVDCSLRSPPTSGVRFAPCGEAEENKKHSVENDDQSSIHRQQHVSWSSPRPWQRKTSPSSLGARSKDGTAPGSEEQHRQQQNQNQGGRSAPRDVSTQRPALQLRGCGSGNAAWGPERPRPHTHHAVPSCGALHDQAQQPTAIVGRSSSASQSGGGGSRRRPRSRAFPSRGGSAMRSPPPPLGGGNADSLGGYMIQQGGGAFRGGVDANGYLGGDGSTGGGWGGAGALGGQQGRPGDRPLSVHQKFSAMVGLSRESSLRAEEEEEETQLLDSLNDDSLLRLHYGLHVTFQAVQGDKAYFMALDMETGRTAMRPLHGLRKTQNVTFKLIDLEDPESYRSILYGRSVWLQIVPGPGEPTWKQGSVLGARVHGPGMLPTVVIDPDDTTASLPMAQNSGGSSRPGTSESASSGRQRAATPGMAGKGTTSGNNAPGNPGAGEYGGVDPGFARGAGGQGARVSGVGAGRGGANGGGRGSSAVGGGNTNANRLVGIPYPFRAAATKHGSASGTTNETLMRAMNKSAIVNCRWTVRPVRSDGQSLPSKHGKEVSNMDHVYFEQDFFYMTRVSENASVVLKALTHKSRAGSTSGGGGSAGGGKRRAAHKHHPVGRRGVFQLQVADADELRPGEERSAALMRKAKRGLKRSEARRSGHRTYVHRQRPEERLTSGAAFPREIRVRTTHFASESESRAISSASHSPPQGAIIGSGGGGKSRMGGYTSGGGTGAGGCDYGSAGGDDWDCYGDGGGSAWLTSSSAATLFHTGSWGSKLLQAMTDAARAPPGLGVTASHARVLREWRQRWGHLSVHSSQADDNSSLGSATGHDNYSSGNISGINPGDADHDHRGRGGSSGDEDDRGGVHVSPMCPRCRYLNLHPLEPSFSVADDADSSATFASSISATSAAPAAAPAAAAVAGVDSTLGRYCLCSINREIQREVLQGNTIGSHARVATVDPGLAPMSAAAAAATAMAPEMNKTGDEILVAARTAEGSAHLVAPAHSRASTPGGGAVAVAATSGEPLLPPEGAGGVTADTPPFGSAGGAEREDSSRIGRTLSRAPSSNVLGESGPLLVGTGGVAGGVGATGGFKRARDRRADRRKKKDPFEALEERLLDGFSLESITQRLQQQDETLQKGVRHVERMESRRHASGRRSNEEHQRYLMIQKKRFEAVVTDSLAEALAGSAREDEGEEETAAPEDAATATETA